MPDSCANALAPTIALLGCTGKPVMPETSWLAGTICVASMPVSQENMSWRVRTAITISSSDALPARSPRPLIVHSTWRAPFSTADERVGDRQPEVVVAVHRPDHLVGIGNALAQRPDQRAELLGQRVADRVRAR